MKKQQLVYFSVFLLFLVVFTSCKKETHVSGVSLSSDSLTLIIDETATLMATVYPENAINKKISWTSSNSNVAIVEDGFVTAVAKGIITITVTTEDGGYKANCTVEVDPARHPAEPELVFVKGGTFTMGCSDDECWDDELPQHQVTLSDFKIAKYPVTQQQWVTIMGTNIWGQLYDDNFPAEHVVIWEDKSFLNAQDFIDKLNVITGKNYRLPTEAEWEYAARGGSKSKGYKYSGCDDINDVAWYIDNNEKKPHPVGTKKPNELGIYDMSGSVFEWCSDLFGDYTAEPQINPQGTASGLCHVLRGGAYDTKKQLCRVSTRFYYCPNERYFIMGFRLVLP